MRRLPWIGVLLRPQRPRQGAKKTQGSRPVLLLRAPFKTCETRTQGRVACPAERPNSPALPAPVSYEIPEAPMRAGSGTVLGSVCLARGPTAGHDAISLTGDSAPAHDFGHLLKADLVDRLRDLPLIPVGVERHEDPVPKELLHRFQQDLETGCLDGSVG